MNNNQSRTLSMEKPISRVVIVGGGTAGWLAAGMVAARHTMYHQSQRLEVQLVESPTVRPIGVGEGSWPSLRDTLMQIGISEHVFLTACHASFKQGSSFHQWRYDHQPHQYHHPFTTPTGYTELDTHACWRQFAADQPYADSFCVQPAMCELGKAPKQASTPEYAYVMNYGYHFDAGALAELLASHCTGKLGVIHTRAHIETVTSNATGAITSLITDSGDCIEGDLFIDCSGQEGLLIDKHFNVPWRSVSSELLNDRAVAVQAPYGDNDNTIASTTLATAHDTGWLWDIGLQHRRGVGCVYGSDFTTKAQAEDTLLAYLQRRLTPQAATDLEIRHLSFKPGYREQLWVHNCLSLGMSSGFVEPLEASAIAMAELGLRMLCDEFPTTQSHMRHLSARYNRRFQYRWQRVIDFLKLHYVLSERSSPYWRAQRAATTRSDSLSELLDLWRYQPPSRYDFIENEEIFPSASYQYVLYGMGFHTRAARLNMHTEQALKAQSVQTHLKTILRQYQQGLPDNRSLLNHIRQHPPYSAGKKVTKEDHHDIIGFR